MHTYIYIYIYMVYHCILKIYYYNHELSKQSLSLLLMLDDLNLDKPTQNCVIGKVMNIATRCTNYVFCRRNRPWNNPDLLDF